MRLFPSPFPPPLLDDAGGIVIARIDISIIVRLRYYRAGILSRNRNPSRIRSIFLCYLPRLPRWWRLSSEWRIITANRRTIAGRRGRIKVHEEGAKETGNWKTAIRSFFVRFESNEPSSSPPLPVVVLITKFCQTPYRITYIHITNRRN